MTRAHKGWALDTVTIHNEVLRQTKEEITSPPAVGASGTILDLGMEAQVLPKATLSTSVKSVCFAARISSIVTRKPQNQSLLHLPE